MKRTYNTDPGYITLPEANRTILSILSEKQKLTQGSYYPLLLKGAQKGLFSMKSYKKRMYQVKKDEIIKFAKECCSQITTDELSNHIQKY